MIPFRWFESCISTPCCLGGFTVRPVLYEANDETQADTSDADLLRGARAFPASRRSHVLRPQAGDRGLDRELLAGPAHDRVRRAGSARGWRLPDRAPGARRPSPQALLDDRRRPRGAAGVDHRARHVAAATARRDDAEGLRRG